MLSTKKMEEIMGWLLTLGTLISAALVLIGGGVYLMQYGHTKIDISALQDHAQPTSIKQIWETALSFSPLGIVELGLLLLVATQILRVGLLAWFYAAIRDYRFTLISVFILLTLIYSFVLRN